MLEMPRFDKFKDKIKILRNDNFLFIAAIA